MSARFSSEPIPETKPKKAPKNFIYVNLPARDQKELRAAARACGYDLRSVLKLAVWQAGQELKELQKLINQTGLRPRAVRDLVRGRESN